MNWLYYPYFYFSIAILWILAVVLLFNFKRRNVERIAIGLTIVGSLCLSCFIIFLWIELSRPPMRTLGETRLWYTFFLPLTGLVVYYKWRFRWFVQYSIALALVFLTINFLKTETHEKTLMPALQSIWFVPHVVVYIFSYALLAASSFVAIRELFSGNALGEKKGSLALADNLVYLGFGFLTLGLLFGALWAKEAWGDYWTWDPKETWALLTWLGYMVYIHIRHHNPQKHTMALWILAISFTLLLFCWFGINYLPAAQNSVHTYTS